MGTAPPSAREDHDVASQRAQLPTVNVLVIDDDLDTRELVGTIITNAGYTASVACSGREALEQLQALRPQLILLDLQMPDLDGAQFREQQRRNPEWLAIPTVVMTGSREEPQLDLAINATLHKPVRASEFLSFVRQHCTRA